MVKDMEQKNYQEPPIVLIADDVEANRLVLKNIMAEMGCQTVLAENGVQAVKLAVHVEPQLIILDVAMPEMDGYEACTRLKEDAKTKEIPVVFISALDNPTDIIQGFSIGGEDYIIKPFISEVVKARVGLHLKLYEANRRMMEMNRQLQISIGEQVHQMELERRSVLYALIRVAREHACYDTRYMERLSRNCRILAEAMQLSEAFDHLVSDSFVDTMEIAAPLCDLGNIAIPTNILQKQGPLTEEEKLIMQTHTVIGARILDDIKDSGNENRLICMAMEITRCHHESWDGTGYPDRKKGEEIPLSAQIVSIVSAYCALTENRTYREAFSKEEAFFILERDEYHKFNPKIFDIMKKIMRQLC